MAVVLIIGSLLIVYLSQLTGGSCPAGWRYYMDNCSCFYMSKTVADQTTARSLCQEMGADLASISNHAEMNFVNRNSIRYYGYWFGLYKVSATIDAATKWYDGNPSKYRNWAEDEPNQNTTCVRYTRDGFKDRNCSIYHYYTCKKHAVLGVTVGLRHFLRCRTYQYGVFTITCPCNHVIRIESAEVGFSQPCLHSVECRKPITLTDYPSIMSCNGRRRCRFSKNVLNSYECGRYQNFINITYYCIVNVSTPGLSLSTQGTPHPSTPHVTSSTSASAASSNGSTGLIIGVAVGVALLLLIIVVVVVIVVICRNRRKSSGRVNNAGNLSIVSTPNIYGTDDVSSQHLGQSFPLDERPSNQADMGYEDPPPVYSATPVYADVRGEQTATNVANTPVYANVRKKPTATSGADNDDRTQPSATSPRSSLDQDITLIDNDLYG